jgi:uncharacterized alpha-E superfamily protein
MYRQQVRRRVFGPDVITFLLQDLEFPRSVAHCVSEAEGSILTLPRPDAAQAVLARLLVRIENVGTDELDLNGIHELMDSLQLDISQVHTAISETWFLSEEVRAL